MSLRILCALAALIVVVGTTGARAAGYDMADYNWCFNNMPKFYDTRFEACVDENCGRISNKKVSQKRACYRRCKGEVVEACLERRAEGPKTKTAPVATAPYSQKPAAMQPTAQPSQPAQAAQPTPSAQPMHAPAQQQARAVPQAAEPAAEPKREEGFFNRLWQGFGSSSEPAAQEAAPTAATGEQAPQAVEGEGKRKGFFSQLSDGFSRGFSEGFDADYNWCRDNSGGFFQENLQNCTKGCLMGPSSGASRRQGCIQSCRVKAVDACIARRDGK